MKDSKNFTLACPIPISKYPHVLLAHGGGGKLMHELIETMFVSAFGNTALNARHDAAVLPCDSSHVAFTTDSYTVHPLFFPGGDIGDLAVNGTVNDLAMAGHGRLSQCWIYYRGRLADGDPLAGCSIH